MVEKWTGNLIGKMHNERITYEELASEIGVTRSYISMLLNGKRKPPGTRAKLEGAVKTIIERKHGADNGPTI